MEYYQIALYTLLGILPSLIWLLYYLRKDLHPEPKGMVIKVFIYGALITIPTLFLQIGLSELLKQFSISSVSLVSMLQWFVVIALTEEIAKYFIVSAIVFNVRELDEPLDMMLYMIIGALGFAALENIFYIFSIASSVSLTPNIIMAVELSSLRFIGATFLHTLCSGLLGYFLAISFFESKKRLQLTVIGILAATFLHGLYDFSIITLSEPTNFILPIIIIIFLAIFVMHAFKDITKLKSICKI